MKLNLRAQIGSMLAFLMLVLAMGCGGNVAPADVPLATYVGARSSFNYYVEEYLGYRESITDPAKLKSTREAFEPKLHDARDALDAWGRIVKYGGDPSASIVEYNKLVTFLISELRAFGVIKIE